MIWRSAYLEPGRKACGPPSAARYRFGGVQGFSSNPMDLGHGQLAPPATQAASEAELLTAGLTTTTHSFAIECGGSLRLIAAAYYEHGYQLLIFAEQASARRGWFPLSANAMIAAWPWPSGLITDLLVTSQRPSYSISPHLQLKQTRSGIQLPVSVVGAEQAPST
jgi:hypothetical protein